MKNKELKNIPVDITVIIPFRNRDLGRLRRAIESISPAASDAALEIIVSDFGSDNPSDVRLVCESYGARWLRTESSYWSRSACVNRAIAASSGEYIQIHDVDMIWAPGGLASHLGRLKSHPQSFINSQVWDLPSDLTDYVLETDNLDWGAPSGESDIALEVGTRYCHGPSTVFITYRRPG